MVGLIEPLLSVRGHAIQEMEAFEERVRTSAREDPICRRLMTAPGIGPIAALTFRAAVDEPLRFSKSRTVGAHFGLTPKTAQSGEKDTHGRISRRGDAMVRALLYLAARYQFRRGAKNSWLKVWGQSVAARRGRERATVAVARRLAVTLHRMWVTATDFHWTVEGV
jgi:transposase